MHRKPGTKHDSHLKNHCMKCSEPIAIAGGNVTLCNNCSQSGYEPPKVSKHRGKPEHSDTDAVIRTGSVMASKLSNESLQIERASSSIDCSHSNEHVIQEQSGIPADNTVTFPPDTSRKLWNQVEAVQRDEDVVVYTQSPIESSHNGSKATMVEDNKKTPEENGGESMAGSLTVASELAKTVVRSRGIHNRTGNNGSIDGNFDRISVLTRLKMKQCQAESHQHQAGVHVKREPDDDVKKKSSRCARLVYWLLFFWIIIVVVAIVCNVRPCYCGFLRYFGVGVDWRLRHVGSSPPV